MLTPVDARLADAKRMLSYPPGFRRGVQQLLKPASPAAGAVFTQRISGDFWDRLLSVSLTLATSGTAANRSLAFSFLDGENFIFNQTQIAIDIPQGQTVSQYGDLATTPPVQGGSSLNAEGSATAPAANGTITQLANPPAGTYDVYVVVTMSGTLTAGTDNNNIKLWNGGLQTFAQLDNSIQLQPQPFGPFQIQVNGATSIIAAAVGAGTAGSIYSVSMQAVPVGFAGSFNIPDIVMESGWAWQISVGNIQAADQLSGISLLVERYGSKYARGGYYEGELSTMREIAADMSESEHW